jgi:hypothetical protein
MNETEQQAGGEPEAGEKAPETQAPQAPAAAEGDAPAGDQGDAGAPAAGEAQQGDPNEVA